MIISSWFSDTRSFDWCPMTYQIASNDSYQGYKTTESDDTSVRYTLLWIGYSRWAIYRIGNVPTWTWLAARCPSLYKKLLVLWSRGPRAWTTRLDKSLGKMATVTSRVFKRQWKWKTFYIRMYQWKERIHTQQQEKKSNCQTSAPISAYNNVYSKRCKADRQQQ